MKSPPALQSMFLSLTASGFAGFYSSRNSIGWAGMCVVGRAEVRRERKGAPKPVT